MHGDLYNNYRFSQKVLLFYLAQKYIRSLFDKAVKITSSYIDITEKIRRKMYTQNAPWLHDHEANLDLCQKL